MLTRECRQTPGLYQSQVEHMKKPSKSKMPMHTMPGGSKMAGKSHAGMAKGKKTAKKCKGK